MSHKILNSYEEITYHCLKEVTDRVGLHVFSKLRIADALPINRSGISEDDFSYALKAHFDFVVLNTDFKALFAVEFDGPTHRNDKQIANDVKKDKIATHFKLPLLRINANYVDKKYRGLDLLTYFVKVWFLHEAFYKAQEAGHIPWDEPFDPTSVLVDESRKKHWPFWLSLKAQANIGELFKAKLVESPGANYWVGTDDVNRYRCLAWIHLHNGATCFVTTGMQSQNFPIHKIEILEQIAVIDLKEDLAKVLNGELKQKAIGSFKKEFAFYNSHFKPCGSTIW